MVDMIYWIHMLIIFKIFQFTVYYVDILITEAMFVGGLLEVLGGFWPCILTEGLGLKIYKNWECVIWKRYLNCNYKLIRRFEF